MKFIDLHTHTHYSDASISPHDLIKLAKKAGLSAIGVTDHDTLMGIPEAIEYGKRYGVEIVPGVELSTEENGRDIHILGYLFDVNNAELCEKLELFRKVREERAIKIAHKLKQFGIYLDPDRIKEIAGKGAIGRPHIAQALLEKGYVKSIPEAFEKYIGYDSPAYVPKYKIKPEEAIQLILNAGGIPIIAHPGYYFDLEYILHLKRNGLMGIEVWHPEHSDEEVELLNRVAQKYGFLKTGGTDYHGEKKINVRLGDIKLPYEILQKLKDARENTIAKTHNF